MSNTYPCSHCNTDDGSPLCLQDSRCPSHATKDGDAVGPVKINGMTYMRPILKVAHITYDGTTLVVPAHELLDHIGDDEQNTYQVRFSTMRRSEFEAMPEFAGF
jgi:hypothetical protein